MGDVQLAVRSLKAAPAVTTAAVLTLVLGIGATTAIFSVANGLVLRPLPVKRPQDLVTITSDTALRFGFYGGAGWNYPMWDRLRQRADAFDGAFAWMLQRFDLAEGGEMQPVNGLVASGGFFDTLGVPPILGRSFTSADDVRGGGPDGAVAVISHSLWQRRFGGRPDVAGSRLVIDRVPVTIVGVAPSWFTGVDVGQPFDVAIPFATEALVRGPRSIVNSERALILTVMLRRKPDQGMAAATAALRTLQPDIVGPNAPQFVQEPFVLVDGSRGLSDRSRLRQNYQYPLAILSIVAGIVLVIVCLNVANLLLTRASTRRQDLGVRLALGASPWRLARQQLVEALALGSVGAAGGLLFAAWAGRALVTQLPFPDTPFAIELPLDWRVFAFTFGVALIAVVLFGTLPAVYAMRVSPIEALRHAGRDSGARPIGPLSNALVVAQIALSIVLLSGAGLFIRTMNRLASVPLGFDPASMFVVSVTARPTLKPADPAQMRDRLLEAVTAVPGVKQAAASVWTPVGTGGGGLLTDARGRRMSTDARGRPVDISRQVAFNFVTPGWFGTYRTPVMTGREFETSDGPAAPRVAVVNEALRRNLLADGPALGAAINAGPCDPGGCTVVGVVANAVYGQSLRDSAPPTVYVPLAQSAGLAPPNALVRISVRASGDAADTMSGIAARLHAVDPELSFTFRRLETDLDASLGQERLLALLAGFFGAIALVLSGVGLYGVSSYAAASRRAEIGIRLALGAQPPAVVRAMLTRIALLVLIGTAAGVMFALWLARFVAPLLYGLEPNDPVTLAASALGLAAVAAVAGWIPASRATRVDPAQVLRQV